MKRIVNGLAYDTNKSTEIARSEYETDSGEMVHATLYQTAGRAFFEHRNICSRTMTGRGRSRSISSCSLASESEAQKRATKGQTPSPSTG